MRRRIVTYLLGLGLLLAVGLASSLLLPGHLGRAQDELQKASESLSKTEQQIVDKASGGQRLAEQLKKDMAGSSKPAEAARDVAKYLKELQKRNEDLRGSKEQLASDIASFEAARQAKLGEVDSEIAAIRDPLLKRQMQRIRERLGRDSGKTLSTARGALGQLSAVLDRGTDLTRVSNVFRASAEFTAAISDLQAQAQQVRAFAAEYSEQANTLMAMLSGGVSESAETN